MQRKWPLLLFFVFFSVFFLLTSYEARSLGSRAKTTINGVTYVGEWREIGGRLYFFPDPAVNKGPCGGDYCVYVADSNLSRIQSVKRDWKESGETTHIFEVSSPSIKLRQKDKGSPYVVGEFVFPDPGDASRFFDFNVQGSVKWTPQPGDVNAWQTQEAKGSTIITTNRSVTFLERDSFIRGPGSVFFDTDLRVVGISPIRQGLDSFGPFDPDATKLMGFGRVGKQEVVFEFFGPTIQKFGHTLDSVYTEFEVSNIGNEIPFEYRLYVYDEGTLVSQYSGKLDPNQNVTGKITVLPSRVKSTNRKLVAIFLDPRGKNHLYSEATDYFKVAKPSITMLHDIKYEPTGIRKQDATGKTCELYRAKYTIKTNVKNNNNFPETIITAFNVVDNSTKKSSVYPSPMWEKTLNGGQTAPGPVYEGVVEDPDNGITISAYAESLAGKTSTNEITIRAKWVPVDNPQGTCQ